METRKRTDSTSAPTPPTESIPDFERFERVYIERLGLALFPLKPGEKVPMTQGGYLDSVRSWPSYADLCKGRPHNVGMPTGEVNALFVVDWDTKHGGLETRAALEVKHGALPLSWQASTQSGGIHDFYAWDPSHPLSSRANILPGLDLRANGGYVVVAPSNGSQGAYEWVHPPIRTPLSVAPNWLYEVLSEDKPHGKVNLAHLVQGVQDGSRNVSITQLLGTLLGRGIDPQLAWTLATSYNMTHVHPPMEERELLKTFESIANREIRKRERRAGRIGA